MLGFVWRWNEGTAPLRIITNGARSAKSSRSARPLSAAEINAPASPGASRFVVGAQPGCGRSPRRAAAAGQRVLIRSCLCKQRPETDNRSIHALKKHNPKFHTGSQAGVGEAPPPPPPPPPRQRSLQGPVNQALPEDLEAETQEGTVPEAQSPFSGFSSL